MIIWCTGQPAVGQTFENLYFSWRLHFLDALIQEIVHDSLQNSSLSNTLKIYNENSPALIHGHRIIFSSPPKALIFEKFVISNLGIDIFFMKQSILRTKIWSKNWLISITWIVFKAHGFWEYLGPREIFQVGNPCRTVFIRLSWVRVTISPKNSPDSKKCYLSI